MLSSVLQAFVMYHSSLFLSPRSPVGAGPSFLCTSSCIMCLSTASPCTYETKMCSYVRGNHVPLVNSYMLREQQQCARWLCAGQFTSNLDASFEHCSCKNCAFPRHISCILMLRLSNICAPLVAPSLCHGHHRQQRPGPAIHKHYKNY